MSTLGDSLRCPAHGPYLGLCGGCVERPFREALHEIVAEIKGREWLRHGRGPYAWNDDDYRREAGWDATLAQCADEVRRIIPHRVIAQWAREEE